ncbi:hypothetical protein PR202_gb07799 [Eleusine coracana subsp. coracana]|uniref:Uncharacterized protein n=1 Tax=Eleusine coracana subsp. coracana TaxID=191504 RepID=A0AAV5EDH4_ELECO|nr:hypothetical protein PR202_gb07799 [Eleusine coracana subsp. coracana]
MPQDKKKRDSILWLCWFVGRYGRGGTVVSSTMSRLTWMTSMLTWAARQHYGALLEHRDFRACCRP